MLLATENSLTMHVKNPNGGGRGVGYLACASIGHGQLGQGYIYRMTPPWVRCKICVHAEPGTTTAGPDHPYLHRL
jgi:hypothetical protein